MTCLERPTAEVVTTVGATAGAVIEEAMSTMGYGRVEVKAVRKK